MTALRRERSEGKWHEVKVDARDVTTDAKTGQGRASFKLAKGGRTRSPRKNSNRRILRRRKSKRYGQVSLARRK